jgi:hypothetical protein
VKGRSIGTEELDFPGEGWPRVEMEKLKSANEVALKALPTVDVQFIFSFHFFLFSNADYRKRIQAKLLTVGEWQYVQLSSVTDAGQPACRTENLLAAVIWTLRGCKTNRKKQAREGDKHGLQTC